MNISDRSEAPAGPSPAEMDVAAAAATIEQLVEQLPECHDKGQLRGLATALRTASDDRDRKDVVTKLAAKLREMLEHDPLQQLHHTSERVRAALDARQPTPEAAA